MSSTKNTTAITAAQSDITEAEGKHAALLAEATTAQENVSKAEAELKRIEQCIATDDPTAGLEDLTKADTALRFFKLQLKAKSDAAAVAGGAVATAKTALITARVEAGEYALHMDKLRPEAEALASKIAALLADHAALCDAHDAGRRQLLTDVKDSDAFTQQGTGNPDSPLSWGNEGGSRHKPLWIEVDGDPVPEIGSTGRWQAIHKRVEWIMNHDEVTAAEHSPIF